MVIFQLLQVWFVTDFYVDLKRSLLGQFEYYFRFNLIKLIYIVASNFSLQSVDERIVL